jgi:hypothetical protein
MDRGIICDWFGRGEIEGMKMSAKKLSKNVIKPRDSRDSNMNRGHKETIGYNTS